MCGEGTFLESIIEEKACVVNNGGGGEAGKNESKKELKLFFTLRRNFCLF